MCSIFLTDICHYFTKSFFKNDILLLDINSNLWFVLVDLVHVHTQATSNNKQQATIFSAKLQKVAIKLYSGNLKKASSP